MTCTIYKMCPACEHMPSEYCCPVCKGAKAITEVAYERMFNPTLAEEIIEENQAFSGKAIDASLAKRGRGRPSTKK